MKSNRFILFLVTLLILGACKEAPRSQVHQKVSKNQRLPYFDSPEFTPTWQKGSHKIPNFRLTNQNGGIVTNHNYYGKIYIANFFFTSCPGICPKLTENMASLQEYYRNDDRILLLSHSVMPEHDTTAVLKKYALHHNVDDRKWNLVTGEKKALYKLARTGYFADDNFDATEDQKDFIHTENFILVDAKGYIRGVYHGTLEVEIQRLIRHIELLKNEV